MIIARTIHRTTACWVISLVLFVLATIHPATADVLAVKGKPLTVGVRIVDFIDGQLHVQLPSGRLVQRPIADVQYLRITGWKSFSHAEKLHRDGQLRSAADQYEKLLTSPTEKTAAKMATTRYDRHLLAQCRLLQIYNVLGRFDRAVELYVDIAAKMPACLETLRPKKLPAAGSTFLASAVPHIDKAIARHGNDGIARSLTAWRNTWPGVKPIELPSTSPVNRSADLQPIRDELTRIQKMVADQQFDAALERIQSALTPEAGVLAELYYWQGRTLIAKHEDRDTENARQDRRRAGLAMMRVVIHYPDHPLAPECLYTSGLLSKFAGRDAQAARLWSELISHYPDATEWTGLARQRMPGKPTPASQPANENQTTQPHGS